MQIGPPSRITRLVSPPLTAAAAAAGGLLHDSAPGCCEREGRDGWHCRPTDRPTHATSYSPHAARPAAGSSVYTSSRPRLDFPSYGCNNCSSATDASLISSIIIILLASCLLPTERAKSSVRMPCVSRSSDRQLPSLHSKPPSLL